MERGMVGGGGGGEVREGKGKGKEGEGEGGKGKGKEGEGGGEKEKKLKEHQQSRKEWVEEKWGGIKGWATPDLSGSDFCPYPPTCSHLTRTDEILFWLWVNGRRGREGGGEGERGWVHEKEFGGGRVEREGWEMEEKVRVRNFLCIDDMR